MATNEIVLTAGEKDAISDNRFLGLAAMIGAPMLLIETLIRFYAASAFENSTRFFGFLEFIYIFGWLCGTIALRRLRVTGDGGGARILFFAQITGLILASLLNVQDIMRITPEQTGVFYNVTDAAYPLSHLLMIFAGVLTIRARIWRSLPQRIAFFSIGLALPIVFALSAAFGFERALFVFPVLTMTGLLIIGVSIFRTERRR